jgi:hypothetical protein
MPRDFRIKPAHNQKMPGPFDFLFRARLCSLEWPDPTSWAISVPVESKEGVVVVQRGVEAKGGCLFLYCGWAPGLIIIVAIPPFLIVGGLYQIRKSRCGNASIDPSSRGVRVGPVRPGLRHLPRVQHSNTLVFLLALALRLRLHPTPQSNTIHSVQIPIYDIHLIHDTHPIRDIHLIHDDTRYISNTH